MSNQRGYYDLDLTGFFVLLVLSGAIGGAFLMWLLPIIWTYVKPIIHQLTA